MLTTKGGTRNSISADISSARRLRICQYICGEQVTGLVLGIEISHDASEVNKKLTHKTRRDNEGPGSTCSAFPAKTDHRNCRALVPLAKNVTVSGPRGLARLMHYHGKFSAFHWGFPCPRQLLPNYRRCSAIRKASRRRIPAPKTPLSRCRPEATPAIPRHRIRPQQP